MNQQTRSKINEFIYAHPELTDELFDILFTYQEDISKERIKAIREFDIKKELSIGI